MAETDRRRVRLEQQVRLLAHHSGARPPGSAPPPGRGWRWAVILLGVAVALVPAVVLASHQFSDVPTNHPFHADITALRNAGVTGGCSATSYCPDQPVTRGQMAAFLNRLGALGPGKIPVTNAAMLEGRTADSLARIASSTRTDSVQLTTTVATYGTVTIEAPTAGYVHVTALAQIGSSLCPSICATTHRLRHVGTGAVSNPSTESVPLYGSAPASWVFPVSAGTHTFESRIQLLYATDYTYANGNVMTATFVAFDGSGD